MFNFKSYLLHTRMLNDWLILISHLMENKHNVVASYIVILYHYKYGIILLWLYADSILRCQAVIY